MSKKYIVSGVIILAIAIIGAFWFSARKTGAPASTQTSTQTSTPAPVATNKVEITAAGFQPASIVVKVGTTVTWTNKDGAPHLVASGPHPAHTAYDGTTMGEHCVSGAVKSFDACVPIVSGGSYSFTFTKAGVWKYHDHLNPVAPFFGSVTVE